MLIKSTAPHSRISPKETEVDLEAGPGSTEMLLGAARPWYSGNMVSNIYLNLYGTK